MKKSFLLPILLLLNGCGGLTTTTSTEGDGLSEKLQIQNKEEKSETGKTEKGKAHGGTETGSTESGTIKMSLSDLGEKMKVVGSALLPNINGSGAVASESVGVSKSISYATESDWSKYLQPDRIYHLTDIFGDPKNTPGPVTRIRVILEAISKDAERTFGYDPDITCVGGEVLLEGKKIELPFFGVVPNGTSKNPAFDCLVRSREDIAIYGMDEEGVGRLAVISAKKWSNDAQPDERGHFVWRYNISFITFAEKAEDGQDVITIDLQYAQSTKYNGIDEEFDTSDDIYFKSRSRVTGRVALDADWNPILAAGDFKITKYDRGPTPEGRHYVDLTKVAGRGDFDGDAYFLFSIDSSASPLINLDKIFCLRGDPEGGVLPKQVASSFCAALEDGFDNAYFEGNNTDLISDSADNFIIPDYQTKPPERKEKGVKLP